jgi:hypothetical protein
MSRTFKKKPKNERHKKVKPDQFKKQLLKRSYDYDSYSNEDD